MMKRKIRNLSLALVAICSIGMLSGAGAQAGFTASSYPANLIGVPKTEHVWTFQGQKVNCATVTETGSVFAASETINVNASYSGCTAFGFVNAEVRMNSCYYEYTTDKPSPGSVHIRCKTAGDSITIFGGSCTVHIPEQTPTTNLIDYANSEGGVLVNSTLAGIHSSITKGSFLCPLTSTTTDSTGTTTGSVLWKGTGGVTFDVG